MAIGNREREFASYVVDLMQSVGPVYSKRMFGGFGIFLDGLMFGLIADNVLYIKVDDDNRQDFEEQGLLPFTYRKQEKEAVLSYYQAPEEAMENMDIMRDWGNKGFAAALRVAAKKTGKKAKKAKKTNKKTNSKK